MSRTLTQISDKLEDEVNRLNGIQKAIDIKEEEIKELYEIEKSAAALAALIEAQNQKRQEFESEMAVKKDDLMREIEKTRAEWKKEKEEELNELRQKMSVFPKELETAVNKAVKEATEKITAEAKNREQLMNKEFEGERGVLTTRIESLEKTVKRQSEQIAKLSAQLENSYQKVEDIAVKAIDGSSNLKSLANLQQMMADQTKGQSQEK